MGRRSSSPTLWGKDSPGTAGPALQTPQRYEHPQPSSWEGSPGHMAGAMPTGRGEKKINNAAKWFHREHSPPLILHHNTAVTQPQGLTGWMPSRCAPDAPQSLGTALALCCGCRGTGLLPPSSPAHPPLWLHTGDVPAAADVVLSGCICSSGLEVRCRAIHRGKQYPPCLDRGAVWDVHCGPGDTYLRGERAGAGAEHGEQA